MTDDHGPDCACAECLWARSGQPELMADFVRGICVVAGIGLVLAVVMAVARAETRNPPCDPGTPQPPLIVELPDGTEIPATSIEYDLSPRRVRVIGNDRLFCDGFPK